MPKRKTTIKEVAKAAGVSVATAGRAIGGYGYVSDKTRSKIDLVTREMAFSPNALAQGLRASCTKSIGVVLSDIQNPFFSALLASIESEARTEGFNIIICNTNEDVDTETELLKVLYSKRVDGIIISSSYRINQHISEENLPLYKSDTPIVFIDRAMRGMDGVAVEIDNVKGGYDATRYLLELGHKNIGIVAPPEIVTVENRILGYKTALEAVGIPFNINNIIRYDINMSDQHKLISEWLDAHPDLSAVFCLNSDGLTDVLYAIREKRKSIPEDYSLICWDDCELARFLNITIVKQPIEQLGMVATRQLLSRINEHSKDSAVSNCTLLSADLIKRSSCKQKSD